MPYTMNSVLLTERIDANTREVIRHATAIVDLEKGQRETIAVLREPSSALALLIRKGDEQGGPHRQRRVHATAQAHISTIF